MTEYNNYCIICIKMKKNSFVLLDRPAYFFLYLLPKIFVSLLQLSRFYLNKYQI